MYKWVSYLNMVIGVESLYHTDSIIGILNIVLSAVFYIVYLIVEK